MLKQALNWLNPNCSHVEVDLRWPIAAVVPQERPTLSLRYFCFRSFTPQSLLGHNLLTYTYIIQCFCLGRIMERHIARATARQAVLLVAGIEYSQPQLADSSNILDMRKRASLVNKDEKEYQLAIQFL